MGKRESSQNISCFVIGIGKWVTGQVKRGAISKRVIVSSPCPNTRISLEGFMQLHYPDVELSSCSFRYPLRYERSFENRRHVVTVGDSVQATWVDDRKDSKFQGQPFPAFFLVEKLVEITFVRAQTKEVLQRHD
jgi:hypothetical protein